MKNPPLSSQDFERSIERNELIVDKTELIYNLYQKGRVFLLVRPRRFGKSFLLSQLKYLFLGRKELFKNMWIYDKWNWGENGKNNNPIIYVLKIVMEGDAYNWLQSKVIFEHSCYPTG